jgi:hypothetical protein
MGPFAGADCQTIIRAMVGTPFARGKLGQEEIMSAVRRRADDGDDGAGQTAGDVGGMK